MVKKIKVRKMAEKVNVKKILYNNVIEPSVEEYHKNGWSLLIGDIWNRNNTFRVGTQSEIEKKIKKDLLLYIKNKNYKFTPTDLRIIKKAAELIRQINLDSEKLVEILYYR
jgi:hypothetical protein